MCFSIIFAKSHSQSFIRSFSCRSLKETVQCPDNRSGLDFEETVRLRKGLLFAVARQEAIQLCLGHGRSVLCTELI